MPSPGVTGAISQRFTLQAAAASQLRFIRQPGARAALRAPLAPEPQVQALDVYGNPATSFTGAVTVALGNNPSAATLSGPLTVSASNGVATFLDLMLDQPGVGYAPPRPRRPCLPPGPCKMSSPRHRARRPRALAP